MTGYTHDVIVITAGSAGLAMAETAAQYGTTGAFVEANTVGEHLHQ